MEQDDLLKIRKQKLDDIKKSEIDPYPTKTNRNHLIKEAKDNFKKFSKKKITLAGRLVRLRLMGKACFGNIKDETADIQIYFKFDNLGKKDFEFLKKIDMGDFLEVTGNLFKTHTGEITVDVNKYKILVKTLRSLPEKWHGLKDIEIKHRKRYLDLISNPEVKKRFTLKSRVLSLLRNSLDQAGFLEVETPMLQPIPGGAAARPFITHYNVLNQDFYLRIAPELYLKRLLVGGFEKIYEINRNFRNEGVDTSHNPEFSMLELYYAYEDYQGLMKFVEDIIIKLVKSIANSNKIEYLGKKINFKKPFKRIRYQDVINKYTGIDIFKYKDIKSLLTEIKKLKIKSWDLSGTPTWPKAIDELFKEKVRAKLIEPTFIINHPIELSPLSKKCKENVEEVERFQLYIGGLELMNGFSELNDPIDQRERFEEQAKLRKTGDEEAMVKDIDFIEALEYGMPPTAGLGMGIDRLVMLLTNQSSIREVIFFPHLRKK